MIRAVCVAGLAIVLLGCEPKSDPKLAGNAEPPMPTQFAPPVESSEPQWRRFESNDWYELYELKVSEKESLICSAYHKTDAQLGISISVHIARLADERGFKFCSARDASPTEKQAAMINSMLPGGRVLESFHKIEFFSAAPSSSDNVMEVALFFRIPLDSDN